MARRTIFGLPIVLVCWLAFIAVFYLAVGVYMSGFLLTAKTEANSRHIARIDPNAVEKGRTAADASALDRVDSSQQIHVESGIYIDRIPQLSFRESKWIVDFYIWFRWTDDSIDPGEGFQVIDGKIQKKNLEAAYQNGEEKYALYRVLAEKTKTFSVKRFPRDDHLLTLRIEDSAHRIGRLLYIPDTDESTVSSRVSIPGYDIASALLVQKPHSYKTRRGDPRLPDGFKATYSQLVFGIAIEHPGWALYGKMFLGTFSSVAIALLAFFVGPSLSGPRFSLGVGAFFAAVASTYVVSRQLPQTGTVGLTDFVTGISLVTIFLTLVTSAICVALADETDNGAAYRRFDLASFAVFLVCYVGLNIEIAAVASN